MRLVTQAHEKNLAHSQSSGPSRWFGEEGSRTARLMMYILLAIVLMLMDQRGNYVPRIRSVMELLAEPVFHLVAWPSEAMQSLGQRTRARSELIAENQQLQQQLLNTLFQMLHSN